MPLPKEASGHHTVWVTVPAGRRVALRYASVGDQLFCLGDDGLSAVPDGARVGASIHQIACGPPIVQFTVTVRTVAEASVDTEVLLELLAHVPLGRSLDEVQRNLATQRHRRVVELVA